MKWAALSLLFFALPLLLWHLSAWGAIRRFNEEPRRLTPVEESAVRSVEETTGAVPWNEEARRRREELPAFLRRTGSAFVVATVAYRGGREVRGEDFRILEQAFGYLPRPLARFPFVSSYGPLNFYLANNPEASGGFDRSPLERSPPLEGGAGLYPSSLVAGLPPADLSFVYPAHLHLFNEGYSLGARWIRDHPADFARLLYRKVSMFWAGAASGFTGYNLPIGLSGVRRAVDMVAAEGGLATAWRVVTLAVAVAGLVAGRGQAALAPWLLFLASKVVVTVFFFGYARHGATVIPVLALLAGVAAERWVFRRRPRSSERPMMRAAAAVLLLAVAVETARFLAKPDVRVDGIAVRGTDSFPQGDHRDRRIEAD